MRELELKTEISTEEYKMALSIVTKYLNQEENRLEVIKKEIQENTGILISPDSDVFEYDIWYDCRILNILKANIDYDYTKTFKFSDVEQLNIYEVKRWRNCGKKSIDKIIEVFSKAGVKIVNIRK